MENLCKKCGAVIIIGRDEKNREINLDPRAVCYIRMGVDANGPLFQIEPDSMVDHDQICPKKEVNFEVL